MMICKKKKIIATEIVYVAICMQWNPESPTIDELDPGDYFVKMNTICDSMQSLPESRVVNTAIMGRGKKFDGSTLLPTRLPKDAKRLRVICDLNNNDFTLCDFDLVFVSCYISS